MRKIVAGFAASADGYIEGPNGEWDWIVIDPEIDFGEHAKRFDAYLYGRKSYGMATSMGSGPAKGAVHYVCSRTLIEDDLKSSVLRLKQQPGKDIAVFGGAGLLASLLDGELVDEISFSIIPVLLGGGKPMVEALGKRVWLEYKSSKTYGNGTVALTYNVIYNQRGTAVKSS